MGGLGVKVQHFPLTLLVVLTTLTGKGRYRVKRVGRRIGGEEGERRRGREGAGEGRVYCLGELKIMATALQMIAIIDYQKLQVGAQNVYRARQ